MPSLPDHEQPTLSVVPAPAHQPSLAVGEVLAGRFRIDRFLGQGGMGEVYEAEDLALGERVALKTIRPEIADDEHAIARFKREILLARKVTHPNVCRIFDLFHTPRDRGGEISFLTMELLRGETLAEFLPRFGPMSEDQALPIAGQMAAALGAAHAAGIIHRDFKSANVMLVPAAGEGEPPRAVVTDFGLARRAETDSAASATGFVGTPAYMAPEQIQGRSITTAADIYAFGVVLYEMVTGSRPFTGDTPMAVAVKRLQEPPPSPRSRTPDLSARWEAVILRCLERDPAGRFAAAAEVAEALAGQIPAAAAPVVTRRRAVAAAIFLLLVAGVVVGLRFWRVPVRSSAPVARLQPRRAVAVLGFKNLSGRSEVAWLSTALSEMLISELAVGEKLRTIPGETVARMKLDLSLTDTDSFGQATLDRIRRNVAADFVILGSYLVLGSGGQLRFDLRLQDTAAGETIASVTETGVEAQLFDLVSRSGSRLREKLGAGGLSSAQAAQVRAALPSHPEAARLYSEGLDRLRLSDAIGARDLLVRAVAAEPNQPLPHSALAAAWSSLGYDARAREEAKKAFDASAGLAREDRLSIEARYRETTREWDKAIDIYRTLAGFFPDNLDYGLRLVAAQIDGDRSKDALTTIEALRRLPSHAGDDPRVDLAEATAARLVSDNKRSYSAASAAAAKAQDRGARLLLARARFQEGSALQNLGQLDQARSALEEAHRLYTEAGEQRAVAATLNNLALVQMVRGDLAGARKRLEEALAAYRQIGNKSGEALMLGNVSNIYYMQGDLARAKKMWGDTLAVYREIGEKEGQARMLNNIGSALAGEGDIAEAGKRFEESLALYREIGHNLGVAAALTNVASTLARLGDLAGARKLQLEALTLRRSLGDKVGISETLHGLGVLQLAEGDLTAARKSHEEALALRQEIRAAPAVSESRLAVADLLFQERRLKEAEAAARELIEEFRRLKKADQEVSAHVLLADCLLEQSKVAEAQKVVERAEKLAGKSQRRGLRLPLAIIAARIRAAAGLTLQAARELKTALERNPGATFQQRLEARLALARIERKGPDLEKLEKEAADRGFRRLAQQAAEARK